MIDIEWNMNYYETRFRIMEQIGGFLMSKVPFVRAADVEGEFRTPPRTSKLLLAPKFGGVTNVSMGMNITEVGSQIPDHVHDESEEVLFLISGRAKIVIEGEGEWEIGP